MFILIFFISIIFLISYFINKDILFPSNMLSISYLIFSVFAVLLMIQLNETMILETIVLILLFIFMFMLSSNIVYLMDEKISFNLSEKQLNITHQGVSFISFSRMKLIIIISIQSIALISLASFIKIRFGAINSQTLQLFREATTYSNSSLQYSLPGWVSLLINFSEFASLFSIYVLINNHFANVKFYKNKHLLILSCLIYIPTILLNSSRYSIIIIIAYSLFLYTFFSRYLRRNNIKPIMYIIIALIIILSSFQIIGSFIGRGNLRNSLLIYIGGSIALFNNYLKFPINYNSNVFGSSTFHTLYKGLYKIHLISHVPKASGQNFSDVNGVPVGNVYTSLRAYYGDFGIMGIIIIAIIFGALFGILYYKIKHINLNKLSLWLMVYAYISVQLLLSPYSETFCDTFLSFGFYVDIIILLLLKRFYKIKN